MIKPRTPFIPILILFLMISASCHQQEKTILKLGHGLDPSHSVHKGMEYMAERLRELSGGRMEIHIYASAQLGSERECVELLQIGSLAMTKVSAAIMEGFTPKYKALTLPYIIKSREHAYRVMEGEVGEKLLLSSEPFWLRGLTFYDAGSRSFYTKETPVHHPDDLRGLKIRVMKSPTAVNMVKALGGSPTPISWGELYTALQGGVVDGAENNPPSFYLSHHYEVCKYYSLDEHSTIPDVLLISKIIWDELTEQEQEWLQQAARESAKHQRKLWIESEQASLKAVEEAGIRIIHPDKQPFAERAKIVYEQYKDEPEIYTLIREIQSLQ